MSAFWFHGEYYTIPNGWTCFTADGWTLSQYSDCWLARRAGKKPERITT